MKKIQSSKFDMPAGLISQLGLEDGDPSTHIYIVTEDGDLFVSWDMLFTFDESLLDKEDGKITVSYVDDVPFYDASDLVHYVVEEDKSALQDMLKILIKFHNNKLDMSQKAQA